MQQLSDAWVAQMLELWADGVEARLTCRRTANNHTLPCQVEPGTHLRFIWLGGKGDWKYLRSEPWTNHARHPLKHPGLQALVFVERPPHLPPLQREGLGVRRVCVLVSQDWHDQSVDAAWRHERPGALPFKGGSHPFFPLPGGDDPVNILIDAAHTFHIKGVGVGFCASAVVMMCRKHLFGRQGRGLTSLDVLIHRAFSAFMDYCYVNKKTTGCRPWTTKQQLDMSSNNSFPGTISGKGHDTALVCSWISVFLASQPQEPKLV